MDPAKIQVTNVTATPYTAQQPNNSKLSKWLIALIVFLVLLGVAAIIVGALYGVGIIVDKSQSEVKPEITKNSGLFLISIVTDKKIGLVAPILISQNQSDNVGNASSWASVGEKVGIKPIFDEATNTYKLNIDPSILKYIQTITFVSNPTQSGVEVIPGSGSPNTNARMYTYLPLGGLTNNNICIYTLGKGVCQDLASYQVIEEAPIEYEDLKNLAFKSLSDQGFCIPAGSLASCVPNIDIGQFI